MSSYIHRFLMFIFHEQPTIGWNVLRRSIYIPFIFYLSYRIGSWERRRNENRQYDYRSPQMIGGIRYHPSIFTTRDKSSLDPVVLNRDCNKDRKMNEEIKLLYKHLRLLGSHHPQIEDDFIITDRNTILYTEKYLEELRHQIALKCVEKNIYKDTLEPKLHKRDQLIRESKYPYKHLLYKFS